MMAASEQEGSSTDERTWRGNRGSGRHPDAGQARAHHGRRQQPLDRLGHRQGGRGAGRRARLHLPGRCAEEARRAAGRRARLQARAALRRHRRGLDGRGVRRARRVSGASSTSWSTPSPSPTRPSSTAATSTPREKNFTQTMLISCYSFTALAQRAEKLMSAGRLDADADLLRRREGDAALQRDGRGQGGAGGQRALSRRRPRQAAASASTPSRPGRSRRWPPPASPTSATSCAGTSTTRRCAAR